MPQMPYSTISMTNTNFNSFDNIKNNKHSHDIFSFLKWVIEIKSHPKNVPIFFHRTEIRQRRSSGRPRKRALHPDTKLSAK